MQGRRLLVLVVLFLTTTISSAPVDNLRWQTLAFERHWNPFVRHLFGCPLEGLTTVENCHFYRAKVDYANFRRSCEEAKKLWRLKGNAAISSWPICY